MNTPICNQDATTATDFDLNTIDTTLQGEDIIVISDSKLSSLLPKQKFYIVEETVNIDFDSQNIVGTLTYPKDKNNLPVILILHGFMGNRHELPIAGTEDFFFDKTGRFYAEQGYATLRIDFIGSGDSDGLWQDTTISNQVLNAEAAIDYIKILPFIDKNNIGVLGLSQGGMVAALLSSRVSDVKSLILWVPVGIPSAVYKKIFGEKIVLEGVRAINPDTLFKYVTDWGDQSALKARFFKDLYNVNPIAEIGSYTGSLQVVVGKKDDIIFPQPEIGKLYLKYHSVSDKQKQELIALEEGDHLFNIDIEGSQEHNTALVSGLSFLNITLR